MVLKHEIMLDGMTVSAAFDQSLDMGIVGTTAGTIWYISWSDNRSIRLVSGHKKKVPARTVVLVHQRAGYQVFSPVSKSLS